MTNNFLSRRIALATAVSLTTLACSSVNAQAPYQDTASNQDVEKEVVDEKKGVIIVRKGDVKWKSKDGTEHKMERSYALVPKGGETHFAFKDKDGNVTVHPKDGKSVDVQVMMIDNKDSKPHKIKVIKRMDGDDVKIEVEGGELTKNAEGHDVVIYIDDEGKKHEFKVDAKPSRHFTMLVPQSGEKHRVMRIDRTAPNVWIPNSQDIENKVRIEMVRANADIANAKSELADAMAEVEKEMAEIEDKESSEYMGLEIAQQAIESAMASLEGQHFDEKKMQFQIRKMDKELMGHLSEAMEDVHHQREIIIDLQEELHVEIEGAREEMHEMIIEIEGMGEGEEREFQLKIIEEMEETMGDMSEVRLKALKKAEEGLHETRVELEKQIAEKKAKEAKAAKDSKENKDKD